MDSGPTLRTLIIVSVFPPSPERDYFADTFAEQTSKRCPVTMTSPLRIIKGIYNFQAIRVAYDVAPRKGQYEHAARLPTRFT